MDKSLAIDSPAEDNLPSPEDLTFMKAALGQAKKALALGEVPIGCVIVYEGRIIARGYNRRNTDKCTLSHAEITAIRRASKVMGDWRLEGCTLYVTLEPCQMCAGAIVQARMDRVVVGAPSPKSGCGGTLLNILQNPAFNHQVVLTDGVLQPACTQILQQFFRELRQRNKEEKRKRRELHMLPETSSPEAFSLKTSSAENTSMENSFTDNFSTEKISVFTDDDNASVPR